MHAWAGKPYTTLGAGRRFVAERSLMLKSGFNQSLAAGALMARRIAIVEDELAIRRNFEDALRRQGYQVSGYSDRPSAMEAFSRRLPDLVIIDVGLGDDVE